MSRGPYTISWGILGEGSQESRRERDLEDALHVADATQGTIFDKDGQQLTREDIEEALHPYRKLAEEIAASLFVNGSGTIADRLVLTQDTKPPRDLGGWCIGAVIDRIERCLEGSGLS